MNQYINLNRIEFVVTHACTGRCKHCAVGELSEKGAGINADAAVTAIKRLTERFSPESIMTFGGEPLLFADTVCKIHAAARDCGIPKRQLITNGFFSKDTQKIDTVAKTLVDSGANAIMLSVDAFHQETIPLEPVVQFADALVQYGVPYLRVHPAWVVNEASDNAYNAETKRLLKIFADKGIEISGGNNISPSGNALKYLAEYFPPPGEVDLSVPCGAAPYRSRLDDVNCISINPSGAVHVCSDIGNIYSNDILNIIDNYDPYKKPAQRAVLDGGVPGLLRYAAAQGVTVDISGCRSACGACRKVMDALSEAAVTLPTLRPHTLK